jgi:hypothetical protein
VIKACFWLIVHSKMLLRNSQCRNARRGRFGSRGGEVCAGSPRRPQHAKAEIRAQLAQQAPNA